MTTPHLIRRNVVICGSLGDGLEATEKAFAEVGVDVSPAADEKSHDGELLEQRQRRFDAITHADAVYVFNPYGKVEATAAMEVGWALALGKPIFCRNVPDDAALKPFCNTASTPAEIATALAARRERPLARLNARSSVAELQRVSAELSVQRGFQDEKPLEIMLLMVEEVGELAKALRKEEAGLKLDAATAASIGQVEQETADIFIYLLHLANCLKFDLATAFQRKEEKNSERIWKRKKSLIPPPSDPSLP